MNYANNNPPFHLAIEFKKGCNVNTAWPRTRSRGFASTEGQRRTESTKLDNMQSRYDRICAIIKYYNTSSIITRTQSADILRDMQILRCKIPKRQDTRQYYTTELRHDTIQKHDTQNLTINDEAVTLADAIEFPRLWLTVPGDDTFTRIPRKSNARQCHVRSLQ